MSFLKGGNVIGIVANGRRIENPDGTPLTFIVEDARGETHELFMSLGRMGTYTMLTLPPFEVSAEGDFGGETGSGRGSSSTPAPDEAALSGAPLSEREQVTEGGVPRATIPRRRRTSSAGA